MDLQIRKRIKFANPILFNWFDIIYIFPVIDASFLKKNLSFSKFILCYYNKKTRFHQKNGYMINYLYLFI